MSEFIELGYISGFFGVRGWVKIYSFTRPRLDIKNYTNFYTDKDTPLKFTTIKESSKFIIGKIDKVDNRESAEKLIGKKLFVKKEELPKLKNEYYWRDLVGLKVSLKNGQNIGRVDSIIETGANDVLIIKEDDREILIPFIMEYYIESINLEENIMVVNWDLDWEKSDED